MKSSQMFTFADLVAIPTTIVLIAIVAMITVPNFVRAQARWRASRTLEDLRLIESAMSQYGIEHSIPRGTVLPWNDIRLYLREGSTLYSSEGRDVLGNFFIIPPAGSGQLPEVNRATFEKLRVVAPKDFWKPFISPSTPE